MYVFLREMLWCSSSSQFEFLTFAAYFATFLVVKDKLLWKNIKYFFFEFNSMNLYVCLFVCLTFNSLYAFLCNINFEIYYSKVSLSWLMFFRGTFLHKRIVKRETNEKKSHFIIYTWIRVMLFHPKSFTRVFYLKEETLIHFPCCVRLFFKVSFFLHFTFPSLF